MRSVYAGHVRTWCCAALFTLTGMAFGQSFTIGDVNVVDVENGTVRKSFVRVTNGAIAAIAPAGPKGTVDGSGKYLIPGLWDMHVHLSDERPMLGLYVAHGVLGVRDMGSDLTRTKQWRADVEQGRAIGPRIYTPGPPLDGRAPASGKMPVTVVATAQQAREAVDALDRQGADFLKTLSWLSRDAYFALAQRARVIRAVFAGHVPESVSVWQALDARQKSMEHLSGIALACSSEERELREQYMEALRDNDMAALARIRSRISETFSEARATELFKRMARFDVWQTPTLTMHRRRSSLTEFDQQMVAMMQRNGAGLLAGTDTGSEPGIAAGSALHEELELLAKAGLSPAQALRTATIHPARVFGIDAQTGSIARGKRADMVLLSANPLDDIRNTRRITSVFVRGRRLDRPQLEALLKENQPTWDNVTSPSSKLPRGRSSAKRPGSSRKPGSRIR